MDKQRLVDSGSDTSSIGTMSELNIQDDVVVQSQTSEVLETITPSQNEVDDKSVPNQTEISDPSNVEPEMSQEEKKPEISEYCRYVVLPMQLL